MTIFGKVHKKPWRAASPGEEEVLPVHSTHLEDIVLCAYTYSQLNLNVHIYNVHIYMHMHILHIQCLLCHFKCKCLNTFLVLLRKASLQGLD